MTTQTQHVFGVPILRTILPDGDALADRLKTAVLARREADPEGVTYSNVGSWHSDKKMFDWAPHEAHAVFQALIALIRPATHDLNPNKISYTFNSDIWANISGSGHSHHPHAHPGCLWSGVFYVEPGEDKGGRIVFRDPLYPLNRMYMPNLVTLDANGRPQKGHLVIRPKRGELIAFPSYLTHEVEPYEGETERISVACNLLVTPRLDNPAEARMIHG